MSPLNVQYHAGRLVLQCGVHIPLKQSSQVITRSIVLNTTYHIQHSSTRQRRYRHRAFSDSVVTEKQAVEPDDIQYDITNRQRDGSDFATLLMMIHNQSNPGNAIINVSYSTIYDIDMLVRNQVI